MKFKLRREEAFVVKLAIDTCKACISTSATVKE